MSPRDQSKVESFRNALREAQNSPWRDAVTRGLLASAQGNSELEAVAAVELAPRASHLELHLEGEDAQELATNARSFGVFVLRFSEAGKEYVKDRLHIDRFTSDIMIAPAPRRRERRSSRRTRSRSSTTRSPITPPTMVRSGLTQTYSQTRCTGSQ